MRQFESVPVWGVNFLHRNDVRIQFTDHIANPGRIVPAVATDASMDVIRREGQSHRDGSPGASSHLCGRMFLFLAQGPTPGATLLAQVSVLRGHPAAGSRGIA